jgi:hypothetical protein
VVHVVGPLLVLVASPDEFFSQSSISQKNNVAKFLGPFDVRKVPESQKHAKNKKVCFTLLKPNKRRLSIKPLKSIANKSRSS